MPVYIYNFIHVLGAFAVFLAYGVLIARAILESEVSDAGKSLKKLGAIASGIGLFLLLLGGFGMQARYGYAITEWWILVKLVLWTVLGAMIALINRQPKLGRVWFGVTLGIGALAALLGIIHKFI